MTSTINYVEQAIEDVECSKYRDSQAKIRSDQFLDKVQPKIAMFSNHCLPPLIKKLMLKSSIQETFGKLEKYENYGWFDWWVILNILITLAYI